MKKLLIIFTLILTVFTHFCNAQPHLTVISKSVSDSNHASFEIAQLDEDTLNVKVYNRMGAEVFCAVDNQVVSGDYTLSIGIDATRLWDYGQNILFITAGDSSWTESILVSSSTEPFLSLSGYEITASKPIRISLENLTTDIVSIEVRNLNGESIITKANATILDTNQSYFIDFADFELAGDYIIFIEINGDFWEYPITVVQHALAINQNQIKSKPIIYPNPYRTEFYLNDRDEIDYYSLIPTDGKIYFQGESSDDMASILNSIPSGSYLLRIMRDREIVEQRIMKY